MTHKLNAKQTAVIYSNPKCKNRPDTKIVTNTSANTVIKDKMVRRTFNKGR